MKKLIIGNWKMNPETMEQARALLLAAEHRAHLVAHSADVVVCPPFVFLAPFSHHSHLVKLGAQNIAWAEAGAFTGEISAPQLKQWGIEYVILGHSERRLYFGEDDAGVNQKVLVALKHKIHPVVCLGGDEKAKKGEMKRLVTKQFNAAVKGLDREQVGKVIFAYEPFWAISTMKKSTPATGEHASELISHIRALLAKKVGKGHAHHMKVLYGGTVNKANAHEFAMYPEISGALVGGASLDPEAFWHIVKEFARESIHPQK
jgi:triosephosphate isomerase (TIM)